MKETKESNLRIYLHPGRGRIHLSLEGDLTGGWVGELERCWRALSGSGSENSLSVDVSRVQSADTQGNELLDLMRTHGVTINRSDPGAKVLPWLSRLWNTATHRHRFHVLPISRLR